MKRSAACVCAMLWLVAPAGLARKKGPKVFVSADMEGIWGIVTAAVKEATGRFAARMFPRDEVRARLRAAAREALLRKDGITPFRVAPPITVDVEWQTSARAEMPPMLPGVKRTGARSISFVETDYVDGFKLLRASIALAAY